MEGVQALPGRDMAAGLLRWWLDAGVDTLVEDEPRNWLAAKTNSLPAGERDGSAAARERGSPALLPPTPLAPAGANRPLPCRESEALPPTLADLLTWLRESPDVPEAGWGRTRILPAGDSASGLMILTDMPEPGDAEVGVLMSGELGALFDRMLAAIGRSRSTIWLTPLATVRSVGRIPQDAGKRLVEIARHHIDLVAPKRLLIMGDLPNRALIGPNWQARRGSLQTINLGSVEVPAVATFHPRLLLERPAFKAQAWKDLQLLIEGL
jgi:uracil-DNA glycosylase